VIEDVRRATEDGGALIRWMQAMQATLLSGAGHPGKKYRLLEPQLAALENSTLDSRSPQARWVYSAEATQRALAVVKAVQPHCREIAYCPGLSPPW